MQNHRGAEMESWKDAEKGIVVTNKRRDTELQNRREEHWEKSRDVMTQRRRDAKT